MPDSFAAFILTHGRPNKVLTYDSLRKSGYTGPIYLLVDTEDKTRGEYVDRFGAEAILFDKREISPKFDHLDNFEELRAIVYARNANFEIAKKLGIKYFVQLDDDYKTWSYRFDNNYKYLNSAKPIKSLDKIFEAMLDFYKSNDRIKSIAFAQFGDFVGGIYYSDKADFPKLLRKTMNSWFLSTDRQIEFQGTLNEDVNTYTAGGARGELFFTATQVFLSQTPTSQASGGMTEIYQASGTYRKTFYTVILQPSSVKIHAMNPMGKTRLHHRFSWKNTVPKILSEKWKRA